MTLSIPEVNKIWIRMLGLCYGSLTQRHRQRLTDRDTDKDRQTERKICSVFLFEVGSGAGSGSVFHNTAKFTSFSDGTKRLNIYSVMDMGLVDGGVVAVEAVDVDLGAGAVADVHAAAAGGGQGVGTGD